MRFSVIQAYRHVQDLHLETLKNKEQSVPNDKRIWRMEQTIIHIMSEQATYQGDMYSLG